VTFFVCESDISGTAEPICAKFTWKTCLVPRSGQGHQGQKTRCALPSLPDIYGMECAACK